MGERGYRRNMGERGYRNMGGRDYRNMRGRD